MTPRWTASSEKQGVPRDDQIYVMLNSTYIARLPNEDRGDGTVWLYIGHAHAQTDREVEVLVRTFSDGRAAIVFHAMELGPKYRAFREEHPNG